MKGRRKQQKQYYKYFLLGVFVIVWLWSVWNPASEANWFLENKTVLLFVPVIYLLFVKYIKLSKLSLTLITLFISLHLVGAHYNYGSVPLGYLLSDVTGVGDNLYDKLVHFAFGLLIVYPVREFFLRVGGIKGIWGYLMPLNAILALGALYEVFEWVTVLQYGTELGYLFIGGNDPFDTTKDLAVAGVGALITLGAVAVLGRIAEKDVFWDEMKKSIKRDKRSTPKEDRFLHKGILA